MESLNNIKRNSRIIAYIKSFLKKAKEEKKYFFILYTIIFLLIISFLLAIFYLNEKSLIWDDDCYDQHLKAFLYIVKWYRSLIKNLIINHSFKISTFSLTLGLGNDIITTLHYYGIGDPLNLLGILCPSRYLIYMFQFLIILRLYLSGISFSLYCINKRTHNNYSILAGSLIYVFSFYSLYGVLHHPFFINVCIYFPLMLLGTDKIFHKEKPTVFILSVFISAISNFYFFYMEVILEIFYCIFKVIFKFSYRDHKIILKLFLQFLGYGIIGVFMSGIILLPIIITFLSSTRTSISHAYSLFYDFSYYKNLLSGFVSFNNYDYYAYLGYGGIGLISIFILFKNKDYKKYKIAFLLLTILLFFPLFGAIMNGLSYITNRWIWGYSLLISYISVLMFPSLINSNVNVKNIKSLIIFVSIYIIICYFLDVNNFENVILSVLIIVLSLFIIYFWDFKEQYINKIIIIFSVILSILININYYFSINRSSNISSYLDNEKLSDRLIFNESSLIDKVDNDEFIRGDSLGIDINSSTYYGNSSTNYFWSLSNSHVDEFIMDMSNREYSFFSYCNFDQRTYLNALLTVNYLTLSSYYSSNYLPYGYDYITTSNYDYISMETTQYSLYQNNYSLPLGYTYSTYIDSDYYDSLSSTEKQEALMQGIVIENLDTDNYEETNLNFIEENLDYTIIFNSQYISLEDNTFIVTEENQSITLKFDGLDNSETYLYITGLDYEGVNPLDLYNDDTTIDPLNLFNQEKWDSYSKYKQNLLKKEYNDWSSSSYLNLTVDSYINNDLYTSKLLFYATSQYSFYNERTDFIVNTCYSEQGITSITITFPEVGIYSYDSLQVISQPMDNYEELINNLSEDTLENIEIDNELWYSTNSITGDITLEENKILCMSIPYSTGWTCYVDGEETEILKANTMFMAIELEAGYHEIEFRYSTPGIKIGLVASITGIVLFTGTCIYHYKNPKRKS